MPADKEPPPAAADLRGHLLLEATRAEQRLRRRAGAGALAFGVVASADLLVPEARAGAYLIPLAAGAYVLAMIVGLAEVSLRRRALSALERGLVPKRTQEVVAEAAPRCRTCGAALLLERVECPCCGALLNPRRSILVAAILALVVLVLFVLGTRK